MGVVSEATDTRKPGRRLAIKFLRPGITTYTEIQTAQTLEGKYIGRAYDVLDLSTVPGWECYALVLDWFPVVLDAVLNRLREPGSGASLRFAPQTILRWCQEFARGVQEVHEHGFVHCDIRPGNLAFKIPTAQSTVLPEELEGHAHTGQLIDFGVAVRIDSPCHLRRPEDTFAAPELKRVGGCLADPRTDVYGLGRVFAELAVFLPDSEAGPLRQLAQDCTAENLDDRPDLAEVIARLAIDPVEFASLLAQGGHDQELRKHLAFAPGDRQFVRTAFDQFRAACKDHGGIFLVRGTAGVGKSALLSNWAQQQQPAAAFYFAYNNTERNQAAKMQSGLVGILRAKYQLGPVDASLAPTAQLRDTLEGLRRCRSGQAADELIFVDAVDEAENPVEAANALPTDSLPPGVFFIVSARPTTAGEETFGHLTGTSSFREFLLQPLARENLDNVADFFRRQLGLPDPQAEQLADAAGGIFQLATLMVEELRAEGSTSAQLNGAVTRLLEASQGWRRLPANEALYKYYDRLWERIERSLANRDNKDLLNDFATLLAINQSWLEYGQVFYFLEWYYEQRQRLGKWSSSAFDEVFRGTTWLLDRYERSAEEKTSPQHTEAGGRPDGVLRSLSYQPGTYFRLRHKSIRDYLERHQTRAAVRTQTQKFHGHVAAFYQERAGQEGWRGVDAYGRFFIIRHLRAMGDRKSLLAAAGLLTNLEYLAATLGDQEPGSPTE
jgi:serine/threonine protein kinase